MTSSSIVKVVAAFVAGIVVALGSALIYVRMADMRSVPAAASTPIARPAPAELPDASSNSSPQNEPTSDAPPQPAPVAPARNKIQPLSKIADHRRPLKPAPAKVAHKPLLLAQNIRQVSHVAVPAPLTLDASSQPAPVPDAQPTTAGDQVISSPPPPEVSVPPAPTPAPAPQPHVVTLPVGTVLSVRIGETLSTDHNYTGDTFRATLTSPVIRDGFIIADRGSKVLGRVINAEGAGHVTGVAGLSLGLTEINTTDGQRVPVSTSTYDRKGNSNVGQDTAKIAGGAALGAIIGAVAGGGKGAAIGAGAGGAAGTGAVMLTHGKSAVVENETQITFRLANPVTITEKLN